MLRRLVIYGWCDNSGNMLMVYQDETKWGVTRKPEEATAFGSVEECTQHYLSLHAIPKNYVQFTSDGTLKFLDVSTKQIKLF